MSLKKIHSYLQLIRDTPGTNDKISLLSEMLEKDAVFKRVITLMYDSTKHFKVNRLSKFIPGQNHSNMDLFEFLEILAKQAGTNNSDKLHLTKLASTDKETYEVVTRIINKDAKAGFSGKTINKAMPGLVFLMPYMRCSTEKSKIGNIDFENGAMGQEKADGAFVNVIIQKNGDVVFRSRNGKVFHQLNHLTKLFKKAPKNYRKTVYMGELLVLVKGKILPRKTGNGILNSCLQNAADHDMAKHVIMKLWDAVPLKDFYAGYSGIRYKYRFSRVKKLTQAIGHSFIDVLPSTVLYSLKEAQVFYKQLRNEEKEGAIIKNPFGIWKNNTSPDSVKMKNVEDAELRIVSWRKGKKDTKWEHKMGSVQLESEDKLINVSVSGFTDEEHEDNWNNHIGKIATIEFESIITDKSKPGKYSLYLPRNLELRPDRDTADTYKEIKNR